MPRSTASHCRPSRSKRDLRSLRSAKAEVVSAITGSQLARMAALESRALFRRGIVIGTAMMPAIRQPKNATMNSSPGGNTSTA